VAEARGDGGSPCADSGKERKKGGRSGPKEYWAEVLTGKLRVGGSEFIEKKLVPEGGKTTIIPQR